MGTLAVCIVQPDLTPALFCWHMKVLVFSVQCTAVGVPVFCNLSHCSVTRHYHCWLRCALRVCVCVCVAY